MAPLFSLHLPLGSAGFHRFHRYYEEIRLLSGYRVVVVASFNASTSVDPKRSPWVRMNGFPPRPSSIPSCHDWISGVALTSTLAQTCRPYEASLSLGAAVPLRLPSHTPSRERSGSGLARFQPRAVAYDSWLPPVGPIRDLHPPPFIHARRTQSPYGLLPIPPRSLSLPTYSCVDPPPPSTLISRGEVSHRCWHRGGNTFAVPPLNSTLEGRANLFFGEDCCFNPPPL